MSQEKNFFRPFRPSWRRFGIWSLPLLAIPCLVAVVGPSVSTSVRSQLKLPTAEKNRTVAVTQEKVIKQNPVATTPPLPKTPPQLPAHQPTDVEIRVAIARNASMVPVATSTRGILKDNKGHALRTLPAGAGFYTQPAGNRIDFGSWKSPDSSIWIEAADGGAVAVGENWYRGKVQLISTGSSLLAVNHVNLEPYLYSVVGAEMWSTWPIEALKAQAVAARSYALARKMEARSPFYDLGATQAWQVYKGLSSETSSTQEAVNQTAGQILVSEGKLVDAWYASTDEVSLKAHGGRGMSQNGAMQMAKAGHGHETILGNYYKGAGLARLHLPNFQSLGWRSQKPQ